mmetsp:Transcript_53411/g.85325  ORF Transcript_53411/g.85325 Transcript_53411/m.85325 type:complete len:244 (+) Transcript_53411:1326-2057(+)
MEIHPNERIFVLKVELCFIENPFVLLDVIDFDLRRSFAVNHAATNDHFLFILNEARGQLAAFEVHISDTHTKLILAFIVIIVEFARFLRLCFLVRSAQNQVLIATDIARVRLVSALQHLLFVAIPNPFQSGHTLHIHFAAIDRGQRFAVMISSKRIKCRSFAIESHERFFQTVSERRQFLIVGVNDNIALLLESIVIAIGCVEQYHINLVCTIIEFRLESSASKEQMVVSISQSIAGFLSLFL